MVPHAHVNRFDTCRLGSSILFLLGKDYVAVGSDSKVHGSGERQYPNICKVAVSKYGLIFAGAGMLVNESGERLIHTGRSILDEHRSVTSAASAFNLAYLPSLNKTAAAIRKESPIDYTRSLDGKPFVQVAFALLGQDGPQIAIRTYEPRSIDGEVDVRVHADECLTNCNDMHVGLGHFDYIDRAINEHPERITADPIGSLKYLIGLEITADPKTVGPPIVILMVDRTGQRWIERGECK